MATINAIDSNIPIEITKGGTAQITLTNHGVLVGATTSGITQLGVGTNGQVLLGATTADPAFATLTSTAGSITYTTGANTLNLDVANWVAKTNWTPVLDFGGGTSGITYGTQQGSYVRIDSMVFIEMVIILTNKGSSTGDASITGLPLTPSQTQPMFFTTNVITWTAGNILTCTLNTTPNLQIAEISPVVGTPTNLTNTSFANTSTVRIQGCYLV